jgi:DNA-binding TFAR19-related protein (PDSD5 family)
LGHFPGCQENPFKAMLRQYLTPPAHHALARILAIAAVAAALAQLPPVAGMPE